MKSSAKVVCRLGKKEVTVCVLMGGGGSLVPLGAVALGRER